MRIIRQQRATPAEEFALSLAREARQGRGYDTRMKGVRAIVRDVQRNGDAALRRYEKKFGGLSDAPLRLSAGDIAAAHESITREQRASLRDAAARLAKTERATLRALAGREIKTGRPGAVTVRRRFVPLRSAGCYIPGGQARYPSSAIMSVTPAAIAGVPRIVAVSPTVPGSGEMDPLTVAAADMCGATEIYRVGGAHAVAALAYGTGTIRRVDKIVGPGGPYVTAAKHAVSSDVGIDMLAGPTELGIVADARAPARLVALDLISQAEHSTDTQCFLITTSEALASRVDRLVERIVPGTSRGKIIRRSLADNGFAAVVNDTESAVALANALGPEHLQIMARNAPDLAAAITTPGMVLLGAQSPSAASDYLLGSNHVLPTNGSGSVRGSLSVLDFVKMITIAESTNEALEEIRDGMKHLTDAEGLAAHYGAVAGRLTGRGRSGKGGKAEGAGRASKRARAGAEHGI